MRLIFVGFLVVGSLAGCSSQDVVTGPSYTQRVYTTHKPTGRDETLTWYETERGGAAYNEEAYRHVLAQRNSELLTDHSPEPAETFALNSDPASAAKVVDHAMFRSYSIYELSRWERFCGAGKMDEKDWDFVSKEGRENVPPNLLENCMPPSYTRQEYIDAWKASCHGQTLTSAQRVIQSKTVRPNGICDA